MTYNISIAKAAENDISEAFLWYEDQKDSLGIRFEANILKAINSIQSNPLKTTIRYGNTRVYFLKKFPYGIHFKLNNDAKRILIVAVFHTSRDSYNWKIRG